MQFDEQPQPFAGNLAHGPDQRKPGRWRATVRDADFWSGKQLDDRLCARELGMRIALRFVGRPAPTAQQLADAFPMSRASAYRWLRALKDARGEP